MSVPTCRALCYSCADCFSNVSSYLPCTVLQLCRLFKWCQNLPTGPCVTVVQTVLAMSVPTCRALCYSCADCLSGVRTYLPTLCYSGADCFSNVSSYLPCTVLQLCRLFKWCQNLPTGPCVTVVQTVLAMSVPTCRALCYSCADCFNNVSTYLSGTVLQWCRLF